jgi:hypothetical protein
MGGFVVDALNALRHLKNVAAEDGHCAEFHASPLELWTSLPALSRPVCSAVTRCLYPGL